MAAMVARAAIDTYEPLMAAMSYKLPPYTPFSTEQKSNYYGFFVSGYIIHDYRTNHEFCSRLTVLSG